MEPIKEYKGVFIYHNTLKNEYYCDAKYNSSNYENNTHTGNKIQHIERKINDCEEYVVDDIIQYYAVEVYEPKIELLRVVKRLGKHLYFDDGTSTKDKNRERLYPKSIDTEPDFKILLSLLDTSKEIVLELNRLNKAHRILSLNINQELSKYKKVSVTVDNKLKQE